MKAGKYRLIFCAALLAFVAIIVGVCFVFFGNKAVKVIPNSLVVNNFDGEYYLTAQANANYEYNFVIEQLIDDEYVVVDTVRNKSNSIKISDQKINLLAGNKFRFSACYISETGDKGDFCKAITWVFAKKLATVDENSFVFESQILSWDEVLFAESYKLVIVNSNSGAVLNKESDTNNIFLGDLAEGNYVVYVVAQNSDENIENSNYSEDFSLAIN